MPRCLACPLSKPRIYPGRKIPPDNNTLIRYGGAIRESRIATRPLPSLWEHARHKWLFRLLFAQSRLAQLNLTCRYLLIANRDQDRGTDSGPRQDELREPLIPSVGRWWGWWGWHAWLAGHPSPDTRSPSAATKFLRSRSASAAVMIFLFTCRGCDTLKLIFTRLCTSGNAGTIVSFNRA